MVHSDIDLIKTKTNALIGVCTLVCDVRDPALKCLGKFRGITVTCFNPTNEFTKHKLKNFKIALKMKIGSKSV